MQAVLVIDTCGETGYVAVVHAADVAAICSERELAPRSTQEQLLPAIRNVLEQADIGLAQLSGIAVVTGPGSFTGVRIGLATTKGLCEAASLPLLMLSRLEVLASAVADMPVCAWLQAGRGDVYALRVDASGTHVPGALLSIEAALEFCSNATIVVCEEGLRGTTPETRFVDGASLAHALRTTAVQAFASGRWADIALGDALYLRVPDAELALRARLG